MDVELVDPIPLYAAPRRSSSCPGRLWGLRVGGHIHFLPQFGTFRKPLHVNKQIYEETTAIFFKESRFVVLLHESGTFAPISCSVPDSTLKQMWWFTIRHIDGRQYDPNAGTYSKPLLSIRQKGTFHEALELWNSRSISVILLQARESPIEGYPEILKSRMLDLVNSVLQYRDFGILTIGDIFDIIIDPGVHNSICRFLMDGASTPKAAHSDA